MNSHTAPRSGAESLFIIRFLFAVVIALGLENLASALYRYIDTHSISGLAAGPFWQLVFLVSIPCILVMRMMAIGIGPQEFFKIKRGKNSDVSLRTVLIIDYPVILIQAFLLYFMLAAAGDFIDRSADGYTVGPESFLRFGAFQIMLNGVWLIWLSFRAAGFGVSSVWSLNNIFFGTLMVLIVDSTSQTPIIMSGEVGSSLAGLFATVPIAATTAGSALAFLILLNSLIDLLTTADIYFTVDDE